jgi:hypothetical protein
MVREGARLLRRVDLFYRGRGPVTRKKDAGRGDPPATLEDRVVASVRAALAETDAEEAQTQAAVRKMIDAIVENERKRFARLVDSIRDEYIDWSSINRLPPTEQVEVAKMLTRLAELVGGTAIARGRSSS